MNGEWKLRLIDNVARVRGAIDAAARRAGRPAQAVQIVAVTKYAPLEAVALLPEAGLLDLGENRVQQLVERAKRLAALAPTAGWRWHMIGHLQRNKVKALLAHAGSVHSLDSERLAAALSAQAVQCGAPVDVFVEVNVASEASKTGALPDEALRAAERAAALPGLRLRGLMTMAPYSEDPEDSRPIFAQLRGLLDTLRARGLAGPLCDQLSMGMSQDYAIAVEEGATVLRVGSALFEGIPTVDPRVG